MCHIFLLFSAPPNLVSGPSDHALFSATLILLSCEFEGIPTPDVMWTFNQTVPIILSGDSSKYDILNETREDGRNYSLVTSTLEFTSDSVADTGTYSCSADNGVVNLIGAVTTASSQLYFVNGESTHCTCRLL
jgi:hypothetical protein